MKELKISHDESTCIACGACVSACPEKWEFVEIDGELKVVNHDKDFIPIDSELSVKAKEAEKSCPVNAIVINDTE
ncbi:MAG: ferredoxin [Nanoarchaeota archaeon]